MKFRILWVIDAIIALVFGYFFVVGLSDGSVSSFNMGLWLAILVGLGGVLLGSRALRGTGRAGLANSLLMIVAVPGLLAGLLFVALIVINPKWN